MGLELSKEHPLRKELEKWNKPYRYEPFPKMLYMAQRHPRTMKWSTGDPNDPGFSQTCQRIVGSEGEMAHALDEGWFETPTEALDYQRKLEDDVAIAAAERNYDDRRMSERAQLEAAVREGTGAEHVAEIKELPRARRGWPKGKPRKSTPETPSPAA